MAPEQITADAELGPGTDRYALAQVAFALLTGEPFWAQEANDLGVLRLLQCVATGSAELAVARAERRTGTGLPASFNAWFTRATAIEAASRYPSCTEAVRALALALGVPAAVEREDLALSPTEPQMRDLAPSKTEDPVVVSGPGTAPTRIRRLLPVTAIVAIATVATSAFVLGRSANPTAVAVPARGGWRYASVRAGVESATQRPLDGAINVTSSTAVPSSTGATVKPPLSTVRTSSPPTARPTVGRSVY